MSFLVLFAAVVQAFAPSPLRVYFVGNSLTFRNDLPGLVAKLGRSLTPPVRIEVGMSARDGMTLERHWREGEIVRRVREEDWDVLVLQEQSSRPLVDPKLTEQYVRRFGAAARGAGTEVILLQTWARADDPATELRLAETYRRLAKAVKVRLAPVGDAWSEARRELPAIMLHEDDGVHASLEGTYLTAAVLVGMLAGRSPEPPRFLTSEDPKSAAALQAVAWRTVRALLRPVPCASPAPR
jgi:hypothetical protein